MFYERSIRMLDKMAASTPPKNKPLNYIDTLNQDIQQLISEYLPASTSCDWELACQGEDILAMIEEEEYYREDETMVWEESEDDDFDLYQDLEESEDDDDVDLY